jgi:dolichol-phosphate mannosyltransferase
MKRVKIGILIPTYNESINSPILLEKLKSNLSNLKDVEFNILIVDDNSPDGTSQIVKKVAKNLNSSYFKINVLDRKMKDGYGKACVAGMLFLIERGVDKVLTMDADLSHNPQYIKEFIEASQHSDLIVGSRYIKGGDTPDWPFIRKFLSKYGNYYARLFLGSKIADYTGGFNMYDKQLIHDIDLKNIKSTGYGFLIELKFKASQKSKSISQIPIIFRDRQHGKSKIPKNTLIKNLLLVPRLRISEHK